MSSPRRVAQAVAVSKFGRVRAGKPALLAIITRWHVYFHAERQTLS